MDVARTGRIDRPAEGSVGGAPHSPGKYNGTPVVPADSALSRRRLLIQSVRTSSSGRQPLAAATFGGARPWAAAAAAAAGQRLLGPGSSWKLARSASQSCWLSNGQVTDPRPEFKWLMTTASWRTEWYSRRRLGTSWWNSDLESGPISTTTKEKQGNVR